MEWNVKMENANFNIFIRTENFKYSEFACPCCGFNIIDEHLVHRLQVLRDYIGAKITILSGCRCRSHNAKVGGEPGSYHLKGMACDFTMKDQSDLALIAESWQNWSGGFHFYERQGFIHLDICPRRRFKGAFPKK